MYLKGNYSIFIVTSVPTKFSQHIEGGQTTMTKFAARRRGFTLIELLIVIVVIAILALIVIPRVMSAGRKARESTLRANLHQLRNALEQFQADTGLYPSDLIDITAAKSDPPTTGVNEDGDTETIPSGSYQGPYLSVSGGMVPPVSRSTRSSIRRMLTTPMTPRTGPMALMVRGLCTRPCRVKAIRWTASPTARCKLTVT